MHCSVSIDTGYGLDDRGLIPCRGSDGSFVFATASISALGPTQPPIQCVPGGVPRVKRPGREVDHSTSPSIELKNAWSYTSIPTIRLHGAVPN
jgi:hypothetical protein